MSGSGDTPGGTSSGSGAGGDAARIAELEARIEQLEASGASRNSDRSSGDRSTEGRSREGRRGERRPLDDWSTAELEGRLEDLQQGLGDLRSRRAQLADRLHDLRADPGADPEDIAETARQLRLQELRYREVAARHAAVSREFDARVRESGRAAGPTFRAATHRARETSADPGYAGAARAADPYPTAYASPPAGSAYGMGIGPVVTGVAEVARLGHALVLGHLGALSGALGSASSLVDDVTARSVARAANPVDFSLGLGPDLLMGHWSAADRLAAAPRRAADAFYEGYTGSGASSEPV